MKIRKGFVSNSSSSSFILMIPKESFKEWEESLSKIEKELLETAGYQEEKTILGIECIEISRALGHDQGIFDYTDFDCYEYGENEDENPYEIWNNMMANLPEKGTYIYI